MSQMERMRKVERRISDARKTSGDTTPALLAKLSIRQVELREWMPGWLKWPSSPSQRERKMKISLYKGERLPKLNLRG